RPPACGLECRDLGVRRAEARVPALAHDLAVGDDDRSDQRMRVLDARTAAFRELERALEAHRTASARRVYAAIGSSAPKTAVAATNSRAPASYSSRMFFSPTPPSTWIGISGGSRARRRR